MPESRKPYQPPIYASGDRNSLNYFSRSILWIVNSSFFMPDGLRKYSNIPHSLHAPLSPPKFFFEKVFMPMKPKISTFQRMKNGTNGTSHSPFGSSSMTNRTGGVELLEQYGLKLLELWIIWTWIYVNLSNLNLTKLDLNKLNLNLNNLKLKLNYLNMNNLNLNSNNLNLNYLNLNNMNFLTLKNLNKLNGL